MSKKVAEPAAEAYVCQISYSFAEHAMDWQTGKRVTLAEFAKRQEARKHKRGKRNGKQA